MKAGSLILRLVVMLGAIGTAVPPAFAQNWTGDARRIGMGGAGTTENISSDMVSDDTGLRTIVIPLGLFQVLKDLDIFRPDSDEFDIVRGLEYVASPLHYTVDRDGTGTGVEFVNDIRNGRLSRDLNVYKGFVPVTQPIAYGLASPIFGGTIPVYRAGAVKHGVYVGAGPYLSMRGALTVDQQLVDIFSSETNLYVPNAPLPIDSQLTGQVALAVTGGYRGAFRRSSSAGSSRDRDGIYVAANYNYLRGFRYEDGVTAVRFETDDSGLLTLAPNSPLPVSLTRSSAGSGRGFALDFGTTVVANRWQVGVGAKNVANRITWTDVEQNSYSIANVLLLTGGDYAESAALARPDVRVELPVEVKGDVGYNADRWSAVAEVGKSVSSNPADDNRFNGMTFHTGAEYRFAILEPRGGVFYARERWQPSAGLGLNLGGFGVDTAVYWTDANVQRVRHATFAASLRIGSARPKSQGVSCAQGESCVAP